MPNIFEAIKIKNVEFKNRIVMAPMVPFSLPSGKEGIISDEVHHYYMQRASGGMGLMISQSLSVTSEKTLDGAAGVYADDHIHYLKKIIDKCHNNGTKFFTQLAYPSAGYHKGDSISHLSEFELEKIKFEFVRAAKICKQAGCDGIELHGAHGFFLNMMACPISNERKDEYGGDLNGRLRFVKNIIKEMKMFADDDFIISYRMGWNGDLDLDIQTAQELEHIGIELLHISSGIPVHRKIENPINFSFNETVNTGVQIKKHIDIPVTVVNDIRTIERGNVLLENNLCDFVAYGKPFLTDEAFLKNAVKNYDLSSNMPGHVLKERRKPMAKKMRK